MSHPGMCHQSSHCVLKKLSLWALLLLSPAFSQAPHVPLWKECLFQIGPRAVEFQADRGALGKSYLPFRILTASDRERVLGPVPGSPRPPSSTSLSPSQSEGLRRKFVGSPPLALISEEYFFYHPLSNCV